MARSLSIRLPDEDRQALAELALREYRDTSDQAAYLIADGLRRRGILPGLIESNEIVSVDPRGPGAAA